MFSVISLPLCGYLAATFLVEAFYNTKQDFFTIIFIFCGSFSLAAMLHYALRIIFHNNHEIVFVFLMIVSVFVSVIKNKS